MGAPALPLAPNPSAWRDVNDRIAEGARRFLVARDDVAIFVCECGENTCAEAIYLTLREYERVRALPGRFAVRPGHEAESGERVVEKNERFAVVEKRRAAA